MLSTRPFSSPLVPIHPAHDSSHLPTDAKVDMTTVSKNRFPVFGLFTAPPVRGLLPKGRYHASYAVHRAPNAKWENSASFTSSRWTISHLAGRISSGPLARGHEHETSPVLPCAIRRQAHG